LVLSKNRQNEDGHVLLQSLQKRARETEDLLKSLQTRPQKSEDSQLQSPQKRALDSKELQPIKLPKREYVSEEHSFSSLPQTQPIVTSSTTLYANYVRDSLLIMSKRKFRKARSRINLILTELMDEETDEEVDHQ